MEVLRTIRYSVVGVCVCAYSNDYKFIMHIILTTSVSLTLMHSFLIHLYTLTYYSKDVKGIILFKIFILYI